MTGSTFWGAALSREDGSPADGLHLLWTAPPAAGYSVGGYDIQRRVRKDKPRLQCYTLTGDDLARLHAEFSITTPVAPVSVRATACPVPPGALPDEPQSGKDGGYDVTAAAAPVSVLESRAPFCLRYRVSFDQPHQLVEVIAQVPAALMIAMREGKAVDSRFLSSANGAQNATFTGRGVDEVLIYVAQRIAGLTICADIPETPEQEAAEWKGVPFIAKGIQLPVQKVNPSLGGPAAELALAQSRLVAGETIDPTGFASVARTMNATVAAGPASPMWHTLLTRDRVQDPFVEVRPWPYALSLTAVADWRRALGFGYLDAGKGLVSGTHYDYRITGHFRRRDLEERLLGFHTIPGGTTLPPTFSLDRVRFSSDESRSVEINPPPPVAGLEITGRKGIRVAPRLTIAFDVPVTRVALELEPALAGALEYRAKTTDFIVGLSGSTFTGPVVAAPRVTLQFAEAVDTIVLVGAGFLYGVRVLDASSGNPDDILDQSVVIADVAYVPTAPPAPPSAIGTTNLQQPILPGDPNITTQTPPQPLGFTVRWLPPAPGGVSIPPWPPDLAATPPLDTSFQIERRRVDTSEPFVEIDKQAIPTVFFGNRGSRSDPPALELGIDLLMVFPDNAAPTPPIDPFIAVDDILRSAAIPDGPPPGSLHQYRVWSVDVIGRRSLAAATGSVVRLEKRIPPPRPPGPDNVPLPGVVRPSGVRARVLQRNDPDLPRDDVALLGASENAIVLEWGWGADERERDRFATEFRVYWHPLPPDVVRGMLGGSATLVGGLYEMACALDQPLSADAMKGTYITAPLYPFKVASHTAGTNITIRFEPSLLQPANVPGTAAFEFTPMLTGAELRPSAWPERSAVIPIGSSPPSPFVFRDRLTLDAAHPRARAWVGVSSADAQAYIPDELSAAMLNGGRPGNESSIAAVVAEARYLGRPTFVVPPPVPAVPEDVSPEPVGPTVTMTRDLPTLLPSVTIPVGHLVIVEHLQVGVLAAAISRQPDGTIGVVFPDRTTTSYTLANPGDQAALLEEIATGEPARIENRFLMDLMLRFPAQFETLWQRAVPDAVAFGTIDDALPSKAERWLHRVRLVDPAGHISEGAAIVPRLTRVASTRAPSAPEIAMDSSTSDSLDVVARGRQSFDLEWLVLFSMAVPDPSPLDERVRERPQLLRIPDRRDLYPNDGIRLRLAEGSLLAPVAAVNLPASGTVALPDVLVSATLTPGFARRVSVWALTMTRDGIPSRVTGPVTAHTGPAPLVVPAMSVAASSGTDTATWIASPASVEFSVERSIDAGASWTRVSPWMPRTTTSFTIPGSGPRLYRLVVRDGSGQTATGSPVTPS